MTHNPPMSRSLSRPVEKTPSVAPWDLTGELDALRRELEAVRRKQHTAEEETTRLQTTLSHKSRECQELVESRDAIQKQADQQVQDLEDALGDVQKRMLDSECKVRQLQAHVVAVKEHFGGQTTEELRAQLQDVKAKYEGASSEVGRVRNRLKQSEKALEEYKGSESQLAAEAEKLNRALDAVTAERDELAETVVDVENQLKEAKSKHANVVPAAKFDNMKNLLTNAVDEKDRQLAELREDYDRVLEEVAELHQKLDDPSSGRRAGTVSAEEHEGLKKALEEENATLKRRLFEVTAKSQALIQEVEESEEARVMLQEHLDELGSRIKAEFIPVKDHEDSRKKMVNTVEELKDQLVEVGERCGKAEAQVQHLQTERESMQKNVGQLQSVLMRQKSEVEALKSRNADAVKEVECLRKRCEEEETVRRQLSAQGERLKRSLDMDYVPKKEHEHVTTGLSSTLESVQAEKLKLETKEKESGEELRNVKEENHKLKQKLDKVVLEMKTEYVGVKDHKATADKLTAAAVEAENRANEMSAKYEGSKDENLKLTQELEAQKKELDMIQEAIQCRFMPLTAVEEKETSHSVQMKDLTARLLDIEENYNKEKSAGERYKQENAKLKHELESLGQRLLQSEKRTELEEESKGKFEEMHLRFTALEKQHTDVVRQRAELQEQNALCNTQIQNLQERLKSELSRIATYDSELKALHDAMQGAQDDCKKAREARYEESQKVCALQKELSSLQEHTEAKEALEAEVDKLHMELRREEESNAQRAEDVSALQSELLQATQALEELQYKEDQMKQLKKEKQQLQEEVANLSNRLRSSAEERQEAQRQAVEAKESESSARSEMETVRQQGSAIEREVQELKERYDESLSTICELQRRIQASAQQTEAKDKKVFEL